jgi:signal transduction histidine kinase
MRRRRRTLRTQLTLLYALPFLATGFILLSIPILQVRESVPVGTPGPGGPVENPALRNVVLASTLAFFLLVAVSFVLGWWIAGRFLRPLRTITAAAREISATNLHRRLNLTDRRDEFADLGDTLDDLFGRLEASFAAQRNFVANASHELRTPLTAERALLQVALADPDATEETLRSACSEVLDLGEQQERLIDALLTLASSERGIERRLPLDLGDISARVVASRRDLATGLGLEWSCHLDPAPMLGDPDLVESLVSNLVDNAVRHNVPGGQVVVATAPTRITVTNTGPVIPPEEVDRLFQPFQQLSAQRTRRHGGHGLGLAIVQAIAAAHGADLVAAPRPTGGLEVTARFSASTAEPPGHT